MTKILTKEQKQLQDELDQLAFELPHRFMFKRYAWQKKFYESKNKINLITAANQIGKSTILQHKDAEWITNKKLWPELWDIRGKGPPRQFWYLYPTSQIASSEFQLKWIHQVMPKLGKYSLEKFKEKCEHTEYGWQAVYVKKELVAIEWASGIVQYFKTYSQNVHNLQSGTVHKISCDEELPETLYDELMFRLEAVDGYFESVFTATRNQLLWLMAMEMQGTEQETLKEAFKQQISMYDCRYFIDGSPGVYHDENKIKKAIGRCKNEAEVQRRVFGRFVADEGRKYPTFDPKRHFVKPFKIPDNWFVFGGIDYGTGGVKNHPSAFGFIAVNPEYTEAYIIDGWRGDGVETTPGMALQKYIELREETGRRLTLQCYDPTALDFYRIATASGETFVKAENSHDIGEGIVNTLFKNDMLKIFDTDRLRPLGTELMTLMSDTPKRKAKDDFIDGALRYPCTMIPWDWKVIGEKEMKGLEEESSKPKKALTEEEIVAKQIEERRRGFGLDAEKEDPGSWKGLDAEIEFWNELYG